MTDKKMSAERLRKRMLVFNGRYVNSYPKWTVDDVNMVSLVLSDLATSEAARERAEEDAKASDISWWAETTKTQALQAENELLREALKEVEKTCERAKTIMVNPSSEAFVLALKILQIARQALAQIKEQGEVQAED